jgi:hypothetical protein
MAVTDAIREFKLALDVVEANLNFTRASLRLRPRLNPLLNWQEVKGESKTLVDEFFGKHPVDSSPQYRGLIVVISGAFEQAVRRIVEEVVVVFNSTKKGFDSLPQRIRMQNAIRTGRALVKIQEPLDHAPLNHQLLVEKLATCKPGAAEFCLNPEVFSYFVSSITPEHLEEILSLIEIPINWDDLGRNVDFEKRFVTKGAKATGKAVAEYLRHFTKLRNTIAHSGAGGVVVTDVEVSDFIIFSRVFSGCLEAILVNRLKNI